jgi:hypothetical protein
MWYSTSLYVTYVVIYGKHVSARDIVLDLIYVIIYGKRGNSVAFSPQANYTDRATAACQRS